MHNESLARSDGREVGFHELFTDALRARWLILGVTSLCTIASIITGFVMPKQYRAEILITPTDSPTGASGGLGAMASQVGALASLAGVSISGKGSKEEAVAVLQSRLITESYVQENNLLPVLYADRWDQSSKHWKTTAAGRIPSLWMANQYFTKKIRDVKEDRQTGLVTMRITWRDPAAAATWANDLVRDTNRYLRNKAIQESEKNIAYLNDQASKTNVIEARSAIYSILKEELNKEMIARGREEYALKVLDPAQPPETPSSPSSLLLGTVGFGVGIILSALFVWGRSSARIEKPR
jgi:uncharacterized protein involved in exopolysaccharide biosynthesis